MVQRPATIQGFSVKHPLDFMPREDSWLSSDDRRLLVVADGITRDPHNMPTLPPRIERVDRARSFRDYPNPFGVLKFFLHYPRPSPAQAAADAFCSAALGTLTTERGSTESIRSAFAAGNRAVAALNSENNPQPDYLENDLWACVAAVAEISYANPTPLLIYGFMTDSGVCVLDQDGGMTFRTPNDMEVRLRKETQEPPPPPFRMPEGRVQIRKHFRNNPDNPAAYGALTGEPQAMHYLNTGTCPLNPGDTVLVYTDGLERVITSSRFRALVRDGRWGATKRYCRRRVHTEGTLAWSRVST